MGFLSDLISQICGAFGGFLPAPLGDVVGQFCDVILGFLGGIGM
jgi:hypothetical protein